MVTFYFSQEAEGIQFPDQEGRLVTKNQYHGQTIGVFTSGGDAQGKLEQLDCFRVIMWL